MEGPKFVRLSRNGCRHFSDCIGWHRSWLAAAGDVVSLELLQAAYRNPSLPLATRLRAAAQALPFEHPKLAVTAVFGESDFAACLDGAVKRSAQVIDGVKLIEAPKVIEQPASSLQLLHPSTPDRRFRR